MVFFFFADNITCLFLNTDDISCLFLYGRYIMSISKYGRYIMSISLRTISCLIFFWRYHHVYFFADGVYLFADDRCISWLVLCRRFYVYFFADSIMSISLQTLSYLFLCRQYHDRLFCWRHHVLLFLCRRFHVYFFSDDFMTISLQTVSCLFCLSRSTHSSKRRLPLK